MLTVQCKGKLYLGPSNRCGRNYAIVRDIVTHKREFVIAIQDCIQY